MSMDSNTGYLMDGSGRLAQEHAGLAFDDTFKRMSLDAQFGGGLGAPLASVAERQELVRACPPPSPLYSFFLNSKCGIEVS